ncbi:MAG: hypothetical protein IPF99_33340 [Deltaproteobacteria bacterium]|nr:hypothetical protein [Deltaproteobacteria bacterium]
MIGPRGSGKTTLAETLRFALNGLVGAPRARADMIRTNLGAGAVRLHVETEARKYFIARALSGDPVVDDEAGSPVHGIDLDKGTFLPLDSFTSMEIEAIADEVLGDRRRPAYSIKSGRPRSATAFTVNQSCGDVWTQTPTRFVVFKKRETRQWCGSRNAEMLLTSSSHWEG